MTRSKEIECSVDVDDLVRLSGKISFHNRDKSILLKSKDWCAGARTTWWGRIGLEHFEGLGLRECIR